LNEKKARGMGSPKRKRLTEARRIGRRKTRRRTEEKGEE
jgi:hypothetical protein